VRFAARSSLRSGRVCSVGESLPPSRSVVLARLSGGF